MIPSPEDVNSQLMLDLREIAVKFAAKIDQ
jgi:hypothetical protein